MMTPSPNSCLLPWTPQVLAVADYGKRLSKEKFQSSQKGTKVGKRGPGRAEKMAQWLGVLAVLAEDLDLDLSTPIAAHTSNSNSRGSDALLWPLRALRAYETDTCRENTHTHKK